MDLGSFVRERRRARNLSQQQLADLAGVGLNFVYQLEKNKATVQLDCTRQVLRALGFDLSVAPLAEEPAAVDTRVGASAYELPRKAALPWD